MKVLHVSVEQDDGWYIAQGLEEPGVITQARTLDEIVSNVREVIDLMFDRRDVDIELLLSSRLALSGSRRSSRQKRASKKPVMRKPRRAAA